MQKNHAFVFAGCIAAMALLSWLYPRVIVEIYGRHVPEKWSPDFANMSFGQIYERIGPPQEDVSGKDYQNWLIYQWWGWKQLKLISPHCCPPSSKPTSIVYIVHIYGWYNPVYSKKISPT
jgi:hypothetical protein